MGEKTKIEKNPPNPGRREFMQYATAISALTLSGIGCRNIWRTTTNEKKLLAETPSTTTSEKLGLREMINKDYFSDEHFIQFINGLRDVITTNIHLQKDDYQEWQKKSKQKKLLHENDDGSWALHFPKELNLWNLPEISYSIYKDLKTTDNINIGDKFEKKMKDLGQMFVDCSIYLAKYLELEEHTISQSLRTFLNKNYKKSLQIEDGKDLANEIIANFYNYGKLLTSDQNNKPDYESFTKEIKETHFDESRLTEIDRWLSGESLEKIQRSTWQDSDNEIYKKNRQKALNNNVPFEEIRRKKIIQYFRVLEKAYNLTQERKNDYKETRTKYLHERRKKLTKRKKEGQIIPDDQNERIKKRIEAFERFVKIQANEEKLKAEKEDLMNQIFMLKPWIGERPQHQRFFEQQLLKIKRSIELPIDNYAEAFYRMGNDLLAKEKNAESIIENLKGLGHTFDEADTRLRSILNIEKLKKELEEVRKTENIEDISKKEYEIALTIQNAVNKFQFSPQSNNILYYITKEKLNCAGYSMLGGSYLNELGIKTLSVNIPGHASNFTVLTNGKVKSQDFTFPSKYNFELTDEMIGPINNEENEEGEKVTVKDIAEFSKNPNKEGLIFEIKNDFFRRFINTREEFSGRYYATVNENYYGNMLNLFLNMREEIGIRAYKQFSEFDNKNPIIYQKSAYEHIKNKDPEAAIEIIRKGYQLKAYDGNNFSILSAAYNKLEMYEEALECSFKEILTNPGNYSPYQNLAFHFKKLQNYEQAISFYLVALKRIKNIYPNNEKEETVKAIKEEIKKIFPKTNINKNISLEELLKEY